VTDQTTGDPLVGRLVAQYEIVVKLGGGAMGVVYHARDTKLRRRVALKFLPPQWCHDETAKDRFIREAQTASATDHPNICTIHNIDSTSDGRLFIVMPCYEGETLKQRLESGPLDIDEALRIAAQIANGLAKAHAHGVVHRDIKPGNLMITEEGVKILDFGLAKFADSQQLTLPGDGLVGTPSYMSPEQARGDEADARSDVWAVGVVLYQMLTRELPFKGGYPEAIAYAIKNEPAPSPRARLPGLSEEIEGLVLRALQKDPKLRQQSARELAGELLMLQGLSMPLDVHTGALAPTRQSMVVLPFTSPAEDDDYFADGLTDEIIAGLSCVRALRVISRTSSMRLKGETSQLSAIAASLAVQYVLEGSVRRSGTQLRVTAQLIDVASDSAIWAHKYAGTMEDVFAIQESISRNIVDALHMTLTPLEARRLTHRPLDDIRAYDSYLKAKREMLRFTKDGLDRALVFLQNSETLVGENILLLSATGQVYWQYVNAGISADRSYLAKARQCAERILALDANSEHGHRLVGLVQIHEGNIRGAISNFKRALTIDPNDPDTLVWLCLVGGTSGKAAAVKPWAERLTAIDPLTPLYQVLPAILSEMEGDFAAAIAAFAPHYPDNLDNPGVRLAYGQVLALGGKTDQALDVFEALNRDMPESPFANLGQFYAAALRGERQRARESVTPEVEGLLGADPQYSWFLAQCYALIDDRDRAIDWIRRAADLGFINYPLLAERDPFLATLRSEPAFKPLIEDIRRRWEAFVI
jgi:serine/threonine protein kinase